ncbi:hypothetical protein GKC30_05240 [Pseudodesulfovibrio sp. F-1]|uniref:DUF4398 domain-containing protein n=1 Tax=Pseudodesulfovibrio alkaliphilus TaxID=2661613 RepID=A0A7K1KME1_9BACT|nr:hypothetical protein [Pseudodesulfovibrio alkaliphilus]MUM77032.1 hypothetical protein [Pseudodesulfovibrio alkaliphilus]
MFKFSGTAALALAVLLMAATAPAQDIDDIYRLREMADSEFRIAEKAYRSAKEKYGDSFDAMPANEREEACHKIAWALNDNVSRYETEDVINQRRYAEQVDKLKVYATGLGCPD